jgi:hypothetical protein
VEQPEARLWILALPQALSLSTAALAKAASNEMRAMKAVSARGRVGQGMRVIRLVEAIHDTDAGWLYLVSLSIGHGVAAPGRLSYGI